MSAEDRLRQLIQEIEAHNVTKGTIRIYARGTPGYEALVHLHFENGIKEVTPFVLEPGTELDVDVLIYLLASKKVAFAVKGGGHMSIPKIYPPVGVLISMKRFNQIAYNKGTKTLDVGAGLTFGDVYKFLDTPDYRGLGVVGGDPLVGVGWLLGGGYSLLTNKHGLGIDNVVGFEVLTPSATAQLQDPPIDPTLRNANLGENSDLFKALKGGGHNFGIVTRFTLKTYMGDKRRDPFFSKQFNVDKSSYIKAAMIAFIQSGAPPEAVALAAFKHEYRNSKLKSYIALSCWYYGNLKIEGGRDLVQYFIGDVGESMSLPDVYDAFALRHLPVSLETLQSDSEFVAFDPADERLGNVFKDGDIIERKILTSLTNQTDRNSFILFKAGKKTLVLERDPGIRGRMASISVTNFTLKFIDEAENQAKKLADMMPGHNGRRSSFEIWPFHKDSFNGIKTKDSAWPHEEGKVFGPLVGWFEWSGAENDGFWLTEIKKALDKLHEVALEEGCTIDGLPNYLNITLEKTSVKDIYTVNYDDLKVTRNKYDPTNVMGQAAGFII